MWKSTVAVVLFLFAGELWAGQAVSPSGTWRGESKCLTDAPPCHDEQVVYTIEAIPNRADAFSVRADKIVDGRAVTMGEGAWGWDSKRQTLSFGPKDRLWLVTMHGDRMDGTLTVADGVVFRRMWLTRDPQHPQ